MNACISIVHAPPGLKKLAISIVRSRFMVLSLLVHVSLFLLLGAWVVVRGSPDGDDRGATFRCGGASTRGGIFTAPPAGFPTAPPVSRSQPWKPPEVKLPSVVRSADRALSRIATTRISADLNVAPAAIPSVVDCAEMVGRANRGFFGTSEGGDGLPGRGMGQGLGGHEVNFFGIQTRVEKIAILVDASTSMLFPPKGGLEGYDRVKQEVVRLIRELPETSSFNIVLFGDQVYLFNRQGLLPATGRTRSQAAEWIQPLHDPDRTAAVSLTRGGVFSAPLLADFAASRYAPSDKDLPAMGGTRVDIALLATFEQKPDSIFIISDGEPQIDGWTPSRVLQKVSQWKKEFYLKSSRKLPCVHVVSYEADSKGEAFLRNLAGQNQGKFLRIKGFRNRRTASLRRSRNPSSHEPISTPR